MAIAQTADQREMIAGKDRVLRLTNREIERFEVQYAPLGFLSLWDGFCGRADAPQVRHCRDIVALALVGGGMSDAEADALVGGLPPSDNPEIRNIAYRTVGLTLFPDVRTASAGKKKPAGSRTVRATAATGDTTPPDASETSAA